MPQTGQRVPAGPQCIQWGDMMLRILVIGLCPAMVLVSGCGRALRGLPGPNQFVIGHDRALLEERSNATMEVGPANVPWDDAGRLLGFRAEITNTGDEAIRVGYENFTLIGAEGYRRLPLDPDALEKAFAGSAASGADGVPAELRFAVASGYGRHRHYSRRHYRRHYYQRHYFHSYEYRSYFGYGYPFACYPYYDEYFTEVARERTQQYLASLWRDEELGPGEIRGGTVVFAHRPGKADFVTLRVELRPLKDESPAPAESRRTASPPIEFEFRFEYR